MNRTTSLGLAFLAAALVITACGSDAATATRAPTSVPTDTPTQVPTASPTSTVPAAGSSPTPAETTSSRPSETLATHTWTISEVDSEELKYAIKDSGAWAISTVDAGGDAGMFPSMALDSLDNPVITYYEPDGDTAGHIKLARWNGQAWDIQRIDRLEAPSLGFLGARKNSSLVLDGQDNPVVAYSDKRVVKLAAWDGSTWAIETMHTAGSDPLGQQVSLSMDPSGGLHLTFAVVTRKSPPGVKGPIMYASGTPAG